ncbi:hypothetical protein [Chitiniphilus shinanonensis]|uniref:hypothetical protein n=1 Tax=Chitiniphilus shinanonensis TaxID=553088 RepID=UPI0003A19A83|nr:hypothetical protein [Chitiniphilus shinanonensis]
MSRHRSTLRSLSETRIYRKGKRFYPFTAEATINPRDGKARKWHSLCAIADGEAQAREEAKRIQEHNTANGDAGNFAATWRRYVAELITKKDKSAPKDPARRKIHDGNIQNLRYICQQIEDGFRAFDITQVLPVDIAEFVDQWSGQRMAQVYLSRLSDFFRWRCRRGLRSDNPTREVTVEKPPGRERYITDAEFHAIRDALLVGDDGRPTRSGAMVQCYVDLCYMIYQRTTEIRLLRWDQIKDDGIHFKPTKTERSSGAQVIVPLTAAIAEVLEKARIAYPIRSVYVIHTQHGQPYTANGIGSLWKRARARGGGGGMTQR